MVASAARGSAPAVDGAAPVFGAAEGVSAMTHDGQSGWRTTEFWVAITTWLLPILTLIFHRNLSSLAVPLATVAAGAANAAYTVSRAITKNGHAKAVATMVTTAAAAAASTAGASTAGAGAGAASPAGTSTGAASTGAASTGAGPARAGEAAAGTGPAIGAGSEAAPAAPGLSGADAAELINAMTAALQALTAAVARIPAVPGQVVPAPVVPAPVVPAPVVPAQPAGTEPGWPVTALKP